MWSPSLWPIFWSVVIVTGALVVTYYFPRGK